MLSCSCGRVFPVIDSVPILLSESRHHFEKLQGKYGATAVAGYCEHERASRASDKIDNRTKKRFEYEWLRYPVCFEEEEEKIFREEIQIDVSHFQNKRILDAGCGMGRFTRIAARFGGEVFGVDLSDSVFKAREITQAFPSVHIIQADLLRLPFPDHCFDIIYSFGVLHHTPDTKQAFHALAEKIKANGTFSLWVYGKAGHYKNFVTNPLKKDRAKFIASPLMHRSYWLLVLLREKLSSAIRMATVMLPHPLLYIFCYGLALLGKLPVIKYLTFSVHKDWRVRLLENFDWLAPPFQYHHTKEEVMEWFNEEHIAVQSILEHGFIPKTGLSGIRKQ
jgi:SAM-dependent methyltransferase